MTTYAVIGGTGLNQLANLEPVAEHRLSTPYGPPSHVLLEGHYAGRRLYFLPRHGKPHHLPPHKINYRANLWALREAGVERVIAINAVGGIEASLVSGSLVMPDQLIDYTWGREHTYYDGASNDARLDHIDFTQPYDEGLRSELLAAARHKGIECTDGGTYAATQGPRLETAAEVLRLQRDGCDVVGMTGMPEAALAAELGLAYAAVCLVVNPAAGVGEEPITMEAINDILRDKVGVIGALLESFLQLPA